MTFILIGATATACSFIFILYSLSPKLLKTVLGYRVYVDIFLSSTVTIMAMLSGTISGMVIGAISGIILTFSLLVMKRLVGYRKLGRKPNGKLGWIEYSAEGFDFSVAKLVNTIKSKLPGNKVVGAC